MDNDTEKAIEFIMLFVPYSFSDLRSMNALRLLRVLKRAGELAEAQKPKKTQ